MDEPCSALDPVATLRIEELMGELKARYTIVIVTHNMQQAGARGGHDSVHARRAARRARGDDEIFTNPSDERTERYVTGKFG